jgi:H+/Cl- antiporter ClcA
MGLKKQSKAFVQWAALGALVGVACGGASAAFLHLLEKATQFREAHLWVVYTLPAAGLAIGAIYAKWGLKILGGNNLVIDSAHEDSPEIPLRMAPMVLLGTVLTHLFGGSAGREGTAVQMGASLADALSHRLRLSSEMRIQLLAAGIAGGFGSVFGTPIAGALFGMEVVLIGSLSYQSLVPALVASVVGDLTTRALGIVHTPYPSLSFFPLNALALCRWVLFGLAIAAAAVAFVELTHLLKKLFARKLPFLPLRMAAGGLAVVALWKLVGTSDYLGLGIPGILRAFSDPSLPSHAFAWKLLFTAVTLGAGFLGGEVTPLFFIGACLGNLLAAPLGLPLDLAAGVGMAAAFAAAANTPLSLSVMAVELLGANAFPHVVIAAVVAYLFTGHRGIYSSQRIARMKHGGPLLGRAVPLRELDSEALEKTKH